MKFRIAPSISTLVAVSIAGLAGSGPVSAAGSMCAFRDGPSGPCTCKMQGDGPGQFTVVPKSRCRKDATKPAGTADAPPEAPAASPADAAQTPAAAAAPAEAAPSAAPSEQAAQPASPAEPAAAEAVAPAAAAVTTAAVPAGSGKLDQVRARGKLLCGVHTGLTGFSAQTGSGAWAGLDVDFCRAVAAAALGDAGKVDFVPIETTQRFEALKSGQIDVLARNTTWTMARDVDLELEFAGISYFDGQGFLTSEERGLVSAQQLAGTKVCVEAGTTSETNMAYYFKAHGIEVETQTFTSRDEMVKAYLEGKCDAYTGDRSALYSDRAGFTEPLKHAVLPEVISKEPLGPAVLQTDREFAEIVRWTLAGLINAEEVGFDKSTATAGSGEGDAKRLIEGAGTSGEKLRLSKTWLKDVIAATGNYGEIFETNVGKASPLGMERGINALWKRGGILYAPPMW